jgi:hypothetical protein
MANSTELPGNARAAMSISPPRSPRRTKRPFLDAVRARDGRGAVHAFASEEHRDVLTNTPSIVEGPTAEGRVRPLQLPEDLGDRSTLDDHLSVALGELAKGRAQSDDRHRPESRCGDG